MTGAVLAILSSLLFLAPEAPGQQPRDKRTAAATGTSRITGIAVSAGAQPRPLRRVRIRISGSELEMSRSTITTDDGRFSFDSLPPGRYSLSASKDGFVSIAFGAVRPGRPGRSVALAAGEVRDLRVQLPRGGVITGVLRGPEGDPVPGLTVLLLSPRPAVAGGGQQLMPVPGIQAVTDDRGVYRVFGLAAGSYIVIALPRPPNLVPAEVTPISRAEVQRALSEVQQQRTASRPGMPTAPKPADPGPAPAGPVGLAFAPTYFPGTTAMSGATPITVAAGEVRAGVDFDLDHVTLSTISGHVGLAGGVRAQLTLSNADPNAPYQTSMHATVGADGGFMFRRVPPGHYAIAARALSTAGAGATGPAGTLWGRTEVVVAGNDVEGVGIALEPGVTLAGDLVFEGSTPAPVLDGFRLPLQVGSVGVSGVPFPTPVVEGSQVVLRGAVPGLYRYFAAPHGLRTRVGPWWLKSIVIDGREVLDRPLEILPNSRTLRVTFSDRASQLSGRVTGRDGTPVTEGYVVVFSEDDKTWFHHSRRIAAVQPNAEGRYGVSNLPAGNYFVVATSDLENGEWFDRTRLLDLRASASRVSIAESEAVSHDLTAADR